MFAAHLGDKRFDKDASGNFGEKLRMDRKRRDDEVKRKDEGPPIAGASRERKRDIDERVSLYPLTPEQALKGLLDTPPPSPEDS